MPAPAALAALGAIGSTLGIYSFFDDAIDNGSADRDILENLQAVQDDLAELKGYAEGISKQIIADGLSSANGAISDINRYLDGDSRVERGTIEALAIQNANAALDSVMEQTSAILSTASIDTLAYAFGALQYAMVVRQTVANVMEDGPIGSPGLHVQMKQAASLLYDTDSGSYEAGIIHELENRLITETSQRTEFSSAGIHNSALITTISGSTGHTRAVKFDQAGDHKGFLGFWRNTETYDQFAARLDAREAQLRVEVLNHDKATLKFNELKANALEAHNYLATFSGEGASYQKVGDRDFTNLDDVFQGTSKSDFLSGREGDDELWGGSENVSGGNDGPDALSGGAGNDILRGGDMNDVMRGGAGNDMIIADDMIGQMGTNDTARFEGVFSDYVIDGGTAYATVTSLIDGSRDKLFGVDHLRFDNGVYSLEAGSALDDAGDPEDFVTAETVALLYEAALNRDGDIDRSGLNFYIDVAEQLETEQGFSQGQMIEFIAQDLMTSQEFTDNFGDVNTLTSDEFLTQVYNNVLGRLPDGNGYDFYINLLNGTTDDGAQITKQTALADIAISPENTGGSTDILMSLYEATTPEEHPTTGILLDWYFVA